MPKNRYPPKKRPKIPPKGLLVRGCFIDIALKSSIMGTDKSSTNKRRRTCLVMSK